MRARAFLVRQYYSALQAGLELMEFSSLSLLSARITDTSPITQL